MLRGIGQKDLCTLRTMKGTLVGKEKGAGGGRVVVGLISRVSVIVKESVMMNGIGKSVILNRWDG
jgi:hypothetical protein